MHDVNAAKAGNFYSLIIMGILIIMQKATTSNKVSCSSLKYFFEINRTGYYKHNLGISKFQKILSFMKLKILLSEFKTKGEDIMVQQIRGILLC